MKLTVFQSEKGDCLLLTSQNARRRILVDGGMRASYQTFVAPALGDLASRGEALDLVYVSHIDQDHIAGVLQLMDDVVAWRVHDFQVNNGNLTHPAPTAPRPPQVKEIWHNAFHEQVGENAAAIGDLLAATAAMLSGSSDEALQMVAAAQRELATSIPEAIKLSRRISADQLNIPLNKRFQEKLAFVRRDATPPRPRRLGSLQILVIGPFEEDLAAATAVEYVAHGQPGAAGENPETGAARCRAVGEGRYRYPAGIAHRPGAGTGRSHAGYAAQSGVSHAAGYGGGKDGTPPR